MKNIGVAELVKECEYEYLSVDGALRRLTAYIGPLAKAKRSAVALPEGESISGDPTSVYVGAKAQNYLFEADEAISASGLGAQLCKDGIGIFDHGRHLLLTGPRVVKSAFFRNTFTVLSTCPPDEASIKSALKSAGASKVILRAGVPSDSYWKERKKYESGLDGNLTVHLFILEKEAVIAKKLPGTF